MIRFFTEETSFKELNLGIIYGCITLSVVIALRIIEPFIQFLPVCNFHRLTGYPCPTCGSTRSLLALSYFHFIDAFKFNPLFTLGICGIELWGILSLFLLFFHRKLTWKIYPATGVFIRFFTVIIILLNWLYLIYAKI